MDRKTRTKAPQRSVAQEGLGEAVLTVTVRDGQATEAINKLRSALSSLSSFSTKQGDAASSIGTAIKASTDQATASVARLAESYKRVQSEQQAAISNARALAQTQQTAAREFLSRGVTPLTTTPAAQRQQQNTAAREAIQERRAEVRSLQTAGGSGLTSFLRDIRQREEGERRIAAVRKAGYKDAEFAEKTLRSFVEQRAKREGGAAGGLGKRAGGALGSALIGGGFPLLFGQGVGAAAGGLTGGAVGGAIGGQFGFGLSIVGTIVGDAFDEALNKGKTLAAGLSDPIGKFDELRQAGLISSKALEKNVASLISQGREAEAAAKIQLDLSSNFGDTSELTALNDAYDELSRSFAQLSVLTAKYVAGPLADFLSKLAASFNAISSQKLLDERRTGASAEVRSASIERVRARKSELFTAGGITIGQATAQANEEELATLDKVLGKTRQRLQAEAAIQAATQRQNTIRSLSFRQIDAQVQGYERLGLELEKQRIEQQRLQDLSVPKADAESINREAGQATYRVQAQINDLAKERLATANLDAAQNALALQTVQQRLAAAQQLAGVEQGIVRSTLEQIINIKAGIDAAKRREQELGAQINAARLRGGDAGEAEAARLVGQQKVAAEETKLRIIEGATALRDASDQLLKAAEEAGLQLQKLRENNLRFLTPDQQRAVVRELNRQVQEEAIRRNVKVTFTGTPEEIFREKRAFVDFGRNEQDLIKQQYDAIATAIKLSTVNLVETNNNLDTSLENLNTAIETLADKNWAVDVQVYSDGSTSVYGDVVNSAISS